MGSSYLKGLYDNAISKLLLETLRSMSLVITVDRLLGSIYWDPQLYDVLKHCYNLTTLRVKFCSWSRNAIISPNVFKLE